MEEIKGIGAREKKLAGLHVSQEQGVRRGSHHIAVLKDIDLGNLGCAGGPDREAGRVGEGFHQDLGR